MRDVKINEIMQLLVLVSDEKVGLIYNKEGNVVGFLDSAYNLSEVTVDSDDGNRTDESPKKIAATKQKYYEIVFLPELKKDKTNQINMSVQLVAKDGIMVSRHLKVIDSSFVPLKPNRDQIEISDIIHDIRENHVFVEITDKDGDLWTRAIYIDTEEGDWLETDHYLGWHLNSIQNVG